MKLAHVALWCRDLDRATAFWVEHFGAQAGERYASTRRPGFVSRFVTFDEGATLELMSIPGLEAHAAQAAEHISISQSVVEFSMPRHGSNVKTTRVPRRMRNPAATHSAQTRTLRVVAPVT